MAADDATPVDDDVVDERGLHPIGPKLRRGARWWRWAGASFAALAVAGIGGVWLLRYSIASDLVHDELEKRGVQATYTIDRVGFRTQRLTNLVIGNPDRPDLVADEVEVKIDLLSGARVYALRVDGARLFGRFVDGRLSLGELDKFFDPTRDEPIALPDLDVTLNDARMRLITPWGLAGLKLEGRGNLQDGFRGKLAMVSNGIDSFGCELGKTTAYVDVTISDLAPRVEGPLRLANMVCRDGEIRIAGPQFNVTAQMTPELQVDKANFAVESGAALVDTVRASSVSGGLRLRNNPENIALDMELDLRRFTSAILDAGEVEVDGQLVANKLRGGKDPLRFEADVTLRDGALGASARQTAARLDGAGRGTPLAPILARISQSALRASRGLNGEAHVEYGREGGVQPIRVSDLDIRSASGARLVLDQGSGLIVDTKSGSWNIDGNLSLSGGGLPDADLRLASAPGGGFTGTAQIAPYRAGDATLALDTVRFGPAAGGGTRIDTVATMSGPFSGGRVEGLRLPIDAVLSRSGRFALGSGCRAVTYQRITIASLQTDRGALRLCGTAGRSLLAFGGGPLQGGGTIFDPIVRGRIGSAPITLKATTLAFDIPGKTFEGAGVDVAIGDPEAPLYLNFAQLDGAFLPGSIEGSLAGGTGKIARVPIALDEIEGAWRYADKALVFNGSLLASDALPPTSFNPMIVRDAMVMLQGDSVTADGVLVEPESRRDVATLDIRHSLSSGSGVADIDVPSLVFNDALQPDQIFPTTLGVVANVDGTVSGRGQIRWRRDTEVTSTGTFRTAGMNLAAPFGPVTNLTTEVEFIDLLKLASAPNQTATLGSINPGIEITNGVIDFQLFPEQVVRINGAQWPLLGGTLTLRPTTLDFSEGNTRAMTFDIVGLDAAQFIASFGMPDLRMSGIFDGTLPVTFNQDGARLNDGGLVARPPGGNLAYTGSLGGENLGLVPRLVFQMLRDINYETLSIRLDGPLAGEMVSNIKFGGLSQGAGADRNILTSIVSQIPLDLNINITAPFRQVIFTARSTRNPEVLIEANLPGLLRHQVRVEEEQGGLPPPTVPEEPTSVITTGNPAAPTTDTQDDGAVQPPASEEMP